MNRLTIYRWFIEYAPSLRKKLRRYRTVDHIKSCSNDLALPSSLYLSTVEAIKYCSSFNLIRKESIRYLVGLQ